MNKINLAGLIILIVLIIYTLLANLGYQREARQYRDCGDGTCGSGETYLNCKPDCPKTPEAVLQLDVLGIDEHPELIEIFTELYANYKKPIKNGPTDNLGFTDEEIEFMKVGLEIYLDKPEPRDKSREALLYLTSWEAPKFVLEGIIPEIKDYPKLGDVFIELYSAEAFNDEEIIFMKTGLEIYKEKPKLKDYPREALIYSMSRTGHREWFYDAEYFNQTLIPLAKEITAGIEDDLEAIKAISSWVDNNMIYGLPERMGNIPKDVLSTKRGKCGEYSILIAGLAKSIGIPARIVSVRHMHREGGGGTHAWVEVYIGGDWIPVASTGALDADNDKIIEDSELKLFENNKMLDVFIGSPYHANYGRTDITFGYNNYAAQQLITEVQDMLNKNYNSEAENNLESAKNKLVLWEKEKSIDDRNRIGREAMEHIIRASAILKEGVAGDEIQVAFLEDFPMIKKRLSKEGVITSGFKTDEIALFVDTKTSLTFWEDFKKTLIETNPKVLYLFDTAYVNETFLWFIQNWEGIDFYMLQEIDELIKNEGLDTELNFVLYWSDKDYLETIEFLDYEDIEPVITFNKVLEDSAVDFMWGFIGAIENVKENVTKTNFYLPPKFGGRYDYKIAAMGSFTYESNKTEERTGPHSTRIFVERGGFIGYTILFGMIAETSIGRLPLRTQMYGVPSAADENNFPEYTNLIIVDESGDVLRPKEKEGGYNVHTSDEKQKYYYDTCPGGFINFEPGQNLLIEREGDFIKITETGKS